MYPLSCVLFFLGGGGDRDGPSFSSFSCSIRRNVYLFLGGTEQHLYIEACARVLFFLRNETIAPILNEMKIDQETP